MVDFDKIKARGDCIAYMEQVLHLQPLREHGEGRYPCPWRPGSDSGAFCVTKLEWYDHVEKVGGSILDLCARARHDGDLKTAGVELSEWLGLAEPRKHIVKTYDYHDAAGNLVFQVVRYEPKEFRQRQPDGNGGWRWNLKGVNTVLYRLPEWKDQPMVCVGEGEKVADTLADDLGFPATTAPMGAGKWKPEYTESLRDKSVVIFTDNDAPGQQHGLLVATAIYGVAKRVRLLNVSDQPKGDVVNWLPAVQERFEMGLGDSPHDILLQMMKDAPDWHPAPALTPEPAGQPGPDAAAPADPLAAAKKANERPFANYQVVMVEDARGRDKPQKQPVPLHAMLADLKVRFLGFPHRIGSTLFDWDRDRAEIRYLNDAPDLIAWIAEKSRRPVVWGHVEGALTTEQLYSAVFANAREFQSISGVPTWPQREDVYYTHDVIPTLSGRTGKYLDELIAFFSPATDVDRDWLRVMFATPLYYRQEAKRPLWVIDSTTGQESGKTTLVEMLALLYGGADLESQTAILVQHRQLQNDTQQDRIFRRVLSQGGRRKRLFLLDNVTGRFSCSELATLITAPAITGLAPYGRGEETRPNDLTYCITCNTAILDRDLARRAIFVKLQKAEAAAGWARRVQEWIRANRYEVIADILALVQAVPPATLSPFSRFEVWEAEICWPVVRDEARYRAMWQGNADRATSSDMEFEEADLVRERFVAGLRESGVNSAEEKVWITSDVAVQWAVEAVEVWKGKTGTVMQKLRNFAKAGLIPELFAELDRWPHHGANRKRGIGWNWTLESDRVRLVESRKARANQPVPPEF